MYFTWLIVILGCPKSGSHRFQLTWLALLSNSLRVYTSEIDIWGCSKSEVFLLEILMLAAQA